MLVNTTALKPALATLADLAGELSSLLDAYTARYEQWKVHAAAQREAIRRADGGGVERAASAQGAILEAVAALEGRRAALVNAAAEALPALRARKTGVITLRDIAGNLPVPEGAALRAKAERLRELVSQINQQSSSVAGATRAVLGHIEGLMRHVAKHLSHSGTYTRRGVVDAGETVVSALDLKS
ncbi:hypothetical protein PHYC_02514 [Phycisphaerales bacterium]|nr:hypothetical protein PHYC_02514 [Phycisphaerales bacterium]